MRLPKWFVSISVLATIGVAVGWLWDSDEIASGVAVDSPESAAAPTVAPVQDQISPPANALPAPDLLQTRPTALPSAPEPTPTAAKVVVPAPAASPPQVPALPTAEARAQPRNYTLDLGSNPEPAAPSPAETPAPPTAVTDQEGAARAGAPAVTPPLRPQSLQTLVDERRDQLRRQSDAYRGPRRQIPPWFARYNDEAERYQDARRSQYRRQRDLGRQRHARWTDAICPWTKPRRDRSARHSYQRQMEQLNRRAYREAYRYQSPYGYPGPGGWR